MIDSLIEALHKNMTEVDIGLKTELAVFRRLYAVSILSYMSSTNNILKVMFDNFDYSIDFFALNIQYDKYLDRAYWEESWLLRDFSALNNEAKANEIDNVSDYMPHDVEGHQFTQENIAPFRTAMHLICDMNNLNDTDIKYALAKGLDDMLTLLAAIKDKINNPSPDMMKSFWGELVRVADKGTILEKYEHWKKEVGHIRFSHLKDKQTQVLAKLLATDFLRFRPKPTKGEASRCKLTIDEDALEMDFKVPLNIEELCARFDCFIVWKDRNNYILSLDYEKLGEYIYKHYKEIGPEIETVIECDIMLDAIHEDMAKLKPELKKHLKGYADDPLKQLVLDCSDILNTCQKHLNKEIKPTIFADFLTKLLHDPEMKEEVQAKLTGKSRNKYLCQVIATLYNLQIFPKAVGIDDLARSLTQKFSKPNLKSVKNYIIIFQHVNNNNLYAWTKEHIGQLTQHAKTL